MAEGDLKVDKTRRVSGKLVKGPRRRSSALRFFSSEENAIRKQMQAEEAQREWEAAYLGGLRTYQHPPQPRGSRPMKQNSAWLPSLNQGEAPAPLFHNARREPGKEDSSKNVVYKERELRQIEKQEARSLRHALEDMTLQDEYADHRAARANASRYISRHLNISLDQTSISPQLREVKKTNFRLPSLRVDRRISSGRQSHGGQAGPFDNPADQIYEEPDGPYEDVRHRDSSCTAVLPNPPLKVKVSDSTKPQLSAKPSRKLQRPTAQCANCALPISGRIVSAASQRFHPECFACHHCKEPLECVAFFTEPKDKYEPRLERIRARWKGEEIAEQAEEDGNDDGIRFYCHLDFHELFSPRCRSCKTPIEGEVVLACGGQWHVGHFFCAECGDPFEAQTPFVEREGFAWCMDCHAGRFSGKCKGCRKPVVDSGISAMGAEWHAACFACMECGGDFSDGRFFTRGENEQPVCVACEEIRLKA